MGGDTILNVDEEALSNIQNEAAQAICVGEVCVCVWGCVWHLGLERFEPTELLVFVSSDLDFELHRYRIWREGASKNTSMSLHGRRRRATWLPRSSSTRRRTARTRS